MHFHHLHWAAILVCAVSDMLIGFLWYSPLLFANAWTREMGCEPADKAKMEQLRKSSRPAYLGSFIASLLSAFVLALVFHWLRIEDWHRGLITGFHIWLGFVATVQFTGALFAKQSMKLFAINTGYQLACYLAMSAILGAWR